MTFDGRRLLMEDNLWQKMISDERGPLMEGDLWWKTTFEGRQPLMEDNICWRTTYGRFFPATTFFCCRMCFCWFFNRCHFLSCNKNFMNSFLLIICVLPHSDIKFENKYFFTLSKNPVNWGLDPIYGKFVTFLKNWFMLSSLISECVKTQLICTKIFIKFLLRDKISKNT